MIEKLLILWAGILIGVVVGMFLLRALQAGAAADKQSEDELAAIRRRTAEERVREVQ